MPCPLTQPGPTGVIHFHIWPPFLFHNSTSGVTQDRTFEPPVQSVSIILGGRKWASLIFFLCRSPQQSNIWRGSWFHTVLKFPPKQPKLIIRCDDLFSDVLHRPFLCLRTPLSPFFRNIPPQNEIPRLDDLSAVQFASAWVSKPFILANTINKWPMHQTWSWRSFQEKFKDVNFVAEAVDWALDTYLDYAGNNSDESPLYLFDHSFVEKMGLRIGEQSGEGDYWIPECFGEDFFALFGDQRPDHRWLIIGPERSGSTFHKDPNATRYVCKRGS